MQGHSACENGIDCVQEATCKVTLFVKMVLIVCKRLRTRSFSVENVFLMCKRLRTRSFFVEKKKKTFDCVQRLRKTSFFAKSVVCARGYVRDHSCEKNRTDCVRRGYVQGHSL